MDTLTLATLISYINQSHTNNSSSISPSNNNNSINLDNFIAGKISTVNSNLEIIPDFAFASKNDLETVNIPNAVYIGKYAFSMFPSSASGSGGSGNGSSISGESTEPSEEPSAEEDKEEYLVFKNAKLKNVNMNNITQIDESAFENAINLELTNLPDSLIVIQDKAFKNCEKIELTELPEDLTYIGSEAFKNCPNVQITTFPSNIIYIGDDALDIQNNLDLSTIPDSLVYLGGGIDYNILVNYLSQFVIDGKLDLSLLPKFLFECEMPSKITSGNDYPDSGFLDAFYLPETITFPNNISVIKNKLGLKNAIDRSDSKNIVLPNITTIPSNFLSQTALTSIVIPNGVVDIEYNAFAGNYYLTDINFSQNLKTLGFGICRDCNNLKNVDLPEGILEIGSYMFYNCSSLAEITIPDSVISIQDYAFSGCIGLKDITFSDNITYVGSNAFPKDGAWFNTQPNGIVYIGKTVYGYKNNGEVEESDITIKDGIKSISPNAFSSCFQLTNINIPNSVEQIGAYAFYGCPLDFVDLSSFDSVPQADYNIFNTSINFPIYVKNLEMLEAFSSATNWSQYADRFVIKGEE